MAVPLVTLHFAQSLDGRLALGRGLERAILSSEEGMLCAHRTRSEHDAVLVGIETVLHDDPLLTARGTDERQPLRVVLDSELRLPLDARMLRPVKHAGQVLVLGCVQRATAERRRSLEAAGAAIGLTSSDERGCVALSEALEQLAARGVKRLLVEGGAKVLTAFLRERLASRAELEIAPLWLGGQATSSLCDLGITELWQAVRLERTQVERLGASVLVRGDISYPPRRA